jgi:inosine-uridine nucleoside N-ribohydrolase
VFALGLLINAKDLLDPKYILTTSEQPELSAKCVVKHLNIAERYSDIPVGIGSVLPPYDERASVCGIPGLVGFALAAECEDVGGLTYDADGVAVAAQLIMDSDRDDWWYIAVGGQTSLRRMIEEFPDAAAKIDTLVIMGGNFCSDFEPYPGVVAPTDETNIGCDPAAANVVLDDNVNPIPNIYYVPVAMADEIGGLDYADIVTSAETGSDLGAKGTIDFYKAWSAAGRADSKLLIHEEALAYDPATESTPQFDACAIMVAMELLDDSQNCDDSAVLFTTKAHFLEAGEGVAFPAQPRPAFSLLEASFALAEDQLLPSQCPSLTDYTFHEEETPEKEKTIWVALGYASEQAKAAFFEEMAQRMAGNFFGPGCYEDGMSNCDSKSSKGKGKGKQKEKNQY